MLIKMKNKFWLLMRMRKLVLISYFAQFTIMSYVLSCNKKKVHFSLRTLVLHMHILYIIVCVENNWNLYIIIT